MNRPIAKWDYESPHPDCCELAAAYAFGVARNHPFVDGNKRAAWVVARVFLAINGYALDFAPRDVIQTVLALAAGDLAEDELAAWFRTHLATTS